MLRRFTRLFMTVRGPQAHRDSAEALAPQKGRRNQIAGDKFRIDYRADEETVVCLPDCGDCV
jgi:hypothetical protein